MDRRLFVRNAAALGLMASVPQLAWAARSAAPRIRQLYEKDGSFSDFATENEGQRLVLQGYMAPPLKAEATFFVLTKMPMAVCPFCETEAEWPDDILVVETKRIVRAVPFNVLIEARGRLELGKKRDPETGFVSMVRLTDAAFERVG